MKRLTAQLESWVVEEGRSRIGQIRIFQNEHGCELRHTKDSKEPADALETHWDAWDAIDLARWDDEKVFRPLKSAPSLRRGWRLVGLDWSGLRAALDAFYPAALANYRAWRDQDLRAVTLRETVSRQTGMYRITGKLTTAQADELVGQCCEPEAGCLRRILWDLEPGIPVGTLPAEKRVPEGNRADLFHGEIPVLCGEMCNLLVAVGRKYLKAMPVTPVVLNSENP